MKEPHLYKALVYILQALWTVEMMDRVGWISDLIVKVIWQNASSLQHLSNQKDIAWLILRRILSLMSP